MKYLRDIQNLKGTKVIVRLDLNVPVRGGKILDDFRIRKAAETIDFLKKGGAKIVLMSHIESDGDSTLEPVAAHMNKLGMNVEFVKNYRNALPKLEALDEGGMILLENLRHNEGEKKNDPKFAKELASLADIYVNEAFPVSHRAHASVSAITKFIPSYAGIVFEREVKELSTAFKPQHPFLFILGGAKFETKIPLIEKFMGIADSVFVGGALANNFFKEYGMPIGASMFSPADFNLKRFEGNPKLVLPTDGVVVKNIGDKGEVKILSSMDADDKILDAGPATVEAIAVIAKNAKTILWNGTLGAYEQGYAQYTLDLAKIIAEATEKHGAKTIIGGGDTVAAIAQLGIENKYSFVSTGGGAMLDFLANETLPGIEALETSKA